MAAKTDLPTHSRFAIFEASETDSEKEENEVKGKTGKDSSQKDEKSTASTKKRSRKKEEKASSSNSELREMAFSKLPPSRTSLHSQLIPSQQSNGASHIQSESHGNVSHPTNSSQFDKTDTSKLPGNWSEWKDRDEQFVLDQYQKDLQAALKISAIEAKGSKPKDKNIVKTSTASNQSSSATTTEISPQVDHNGVKISKLDDFDVNCEDTLIQRINGDIVVGVEGQDGLYWEDEIDDNQEEEEKPNEEMADEDQIKIKKKSDKDKARKERKRQEKVKEKEEKEKKVKDTEEKEVKTVKASGRDKEEAEVVRNIQLKDELEKKDLTIETLRKETETLQKDLAQVRKRNKQLCHILGQGEMQDKGDLLIQIQDLQDVRDEMSNQISELVTALEQERSKVSSLKAESLKHQELLVDKDTTRHTARIKCSQLSVITMSCGYPTTVHPVLRT